MQQNEEEILQEILVNINLFRKTSLCFPTDKSMPIIVMLIEQFQGMYSFLTKRQQTRLDGMLSLMLKALQNQDFVLLRDILVYDIYPFFKGLCPQSH